MGQKSRCRLNLPSDNMLHSYACSLLSVKEAIGMPLFDFYEKCESVFGRPAICIRKLNIGVIIFAHVCVTYTPIRIDTEPKKDGM